MAHRKTIRHYHEPGHLHEFTFSCYQRRSLLTNVNWREMLSRCIDGAGEETKINLVAFVFIHRNPVERGLCQRAVDWKWSSARYYLEDPPGRQFRELPFIHGLPAGALA